MLTRLVLIRHGITDWNKQRRYCGCKDIGLSSQGKAQALRLRNILKAFEVERIYSSDRKRALQTCRMIFGRARITKMAALKEINFGVIEGLSHQENIKKYPGIYKKWLEDPFKNCLPKAEPMNIFKKRVQAALLKIVRVNHGKTVAVVCHGGVIGIFVSAILRNRKFWRHVPSAASITVVEFRKHKPEIMLFNDTRHLR